MSYRYRLSGYIFEINIPLPELKEVEEQPECSLLVRASISDAIPSEALNAESYSNKDIGLTCIQRKQLGFVAIWDKKIIEYTPASYLDEIGIRTQLLGTISMIMSAAMGYISFHAGSVIVNNKAFMFCGTSGAGKSTIAAHFYSRGYKILSDDVTTLRVSAHGEIVAYPSIPRIKLSDTSLELIGATNDGLSTVISNKLKYALPVNAIADGEGYNLNAIIFPLYRDGDIMLEQIEGFQNKLIIAQHLYRKRLAKLLYPTTQIQALFLNLAAQIPMHHFYRPCNIGTIKESLYFIETKLNN
ncbi:MAG: hypothetical protein ACTHKV_12055 [Flavipsychrobacter sp.]